MIIAHDLGTTGDKASLHADDGRLVGSCTVPYKTAFGPHGMAEQDPEDWWRAHCAATTELLRRTDTPARDVRAVGFSGQMMGAVFLDRRYRPIRPALIWADHRSTREAADLVARLGAEHAYRVLGHRLHPTYSLSKVMWVRDHEPQNYGRVAHVCLAKDFVVQRLTGVLVTDHSDASSTNAYDQRHGWWSDEILAAAGIPRTLLPEIVESTTVVGDVSPAVSEQVGLAAGTAVVIGGGDGPMAALGTGVTEPADGAYIYLGSSSWISMAADVPIYDSAMRTMTFNHVVPGRFVPTATMQAGGASLEWVADLLQPRSDPDRFTRLLASAAEADTEGLYFLPHLLGERSPYWNANARGAFLGLAKHHGQAHAVRAVLEGVAFNLATCVAAFGECGRPATEIDAIGGGAASDLWLTILADVLGVTVRRRNIVEEANSLGAAVTAAVGTGSLSSFGAARELSLVTDEFTADPDRHSDYKRRHREFLDAYRHLEPWFESAGR